MFATALIRFALALVVIGAPLALAADPAQAQVPVPAPARVIDGPSADVVGLGGMSIARDGTGGVVYLKHVGGVAHVFISRLVGGSFQPPEQVDPGLLTDSSQPVIAAGAGGLLLVAFINGGQLYVVNRASAAAAYAAPLDLFAGASSPALQISAFGKAYLAFTAAGAGSHDVRSAFYENGRWALESTPLDAVAGDDAGTGTGRPQVVAAGDGVGIVVWGESGHVYARRVWGTSPSIVFEQADVPLLSGAAEVSADMPSAGAGGDSSYVNVVFHEVFSNNGQQQSRVLMRRLRASQFDPLNQPDGVTTPGSAGADQPQLTVSEYGAGLITSERTDSHALFAMTLANNGVAQAVAQVDSLPSTGPPDATPGNAGLFSKLIAWQRDPGSGGMPEIRVRYADDGQHLGPEQVLSSPALGPARADLGLAASGDIGGDAAAAWVQGAPGAGEIVTAQMYKPPDGFAARTGFHYVRTHRPVMAWSPPDEEWGPLRYVVHLDGVQVAQTTATTVVLPGPVPDGSHAWQVTAFNPAGLTSTMPRASFWVDTVPPAAKLSLTGKLRAGSVLHAYVSYTDSPAPERPAQASGIAAVVLGWGDGSRYHVRHGKFHAYKRAGRYRVTVLITDRAGNRTTLVRWVKIAAKPRPGRPGHAKPHRTAPPPKHSALRGRTAHPAR